MCMWKIHKQLHTHIGIVIIYVKRTSRLVLFTGLLIQRNNVTYEMYERE